MSITLIRANSDGVVHGADNDKLTGCRKRLQTMSSTREGEMKDIVDLTCDRCKEYFAKKMIRESNREESRMEKEEKKRYQRAKKQGIVSEATYEEYVLNRESAESARRDSKKDTNNYPPLKADVQDNNYPSYQNYNQPAPQNPVNQYATPQNPVNQYAAPPAYQPQQPAQDDYQQTDNGAVPQYTQYQPSYEQYKSPANDASSNQYVSPNAAKPAGGGNDDFLAQFMINKPAAEPEQPEVQVNSAVVYNDPLAAAKSNANSILSQLESEFGAPQSAGKADASSFYNSNSPLVDPASASTFESVTNEFGTFKAPEQPVNPMNSFSVPEVPQLNKPASPVNSFEDLTLTSGNTDSYLNYVNTYDPSANIAASAGVKTSLEKTNSVDNSIDSIVPPVLDNMDSALAAAEKSFGNINNSVVPPVQPTLDAFTPVTPPVQPTLDAFTPVTPPVQPTMDAFAPVTPPIQPAMDAFAPITPPVQPAMDAFAPVTPPVQPTMDAFAPVTPPVQPTMDAFAPVTPPVQPTMDAFASAVPPVQPTMDAFAPVMPQQPVVPQVQPAPAYNPYAASPQTPVMNNTYSAPVQPAAPFAAPVQNNSQFVMPQMAPKAAYQAKPVQPAPANNKTVPVLFNQAHSPMADSIEDALIALGAETVKKADQNQASDKEEIVPNFVAYVPSSSKVLHSAPPVNDYSSAPKRTMSAREAKRAAKIDAKFRKDLIERGYSPDEIKSQRRGK